MNERLEVIVRNENDLWRTAALAMEEGDAEALEILIVLNQNWHATEEDRNARNSALEAMLQAVHMLRECA